MKKYTSVVFAFLCILSFSVNQTFAVLALENQTSKANCDLSDRSANRTEFLERVTRLEENAIDSYSKSLALSAYDQRQDSGLPTVEQILDKYVKAIGGKAVVQAQTSRVMKATITVPAVGGKGTLEVYAKAPNKELTERSLNVLGSARIGFNGTVAWVDENGEVKDAPGFSKREADFYLPIELKEVYPKLELKGKEKVGTREVYVLEAPRAGHPKRWCFDTQTGLLLRIEVRNAAGKVIEREDYEDYRAVDGIQYAFTVQGLDENEVPFVIKYDEIKHNVPINDARFEKPAAKSS